MLSNLLFYGLTNGILIKPDNANEKRIKKDISYFINKGVPVDVVLRAHLYTYGDKFGYETILKLVKEATIEVLDNIYYEDLEYKNND